MFSEGSLERSRICGHFEHKNGFAGDMMKITYQLHMKQRDRGRENDKNRLTLENDCGKSIHPSPQLFCMVLDASLVRANIISYCSYLKNCGNATKPANQSFYDGKMQKTEKNDANPRPGSELSRVPKLSESSGQRLKMFTTHIQFFSIQDFLKK